MSSARVFGAFAGRALMAAAAAAAKGATKKTTTTAAAASAVASSTKVAKKTVRSKSNGGIQKVVPVTSELGKFIGSSQVSRTDAVKKVWEYIKLQNLQNPNNKKEIFCDEKLKTIFDGKDKVVFTEIARLLSNHFVKSS